MKEKSLRVLYIPALLFLTGFFFPAIRNFLISVAEFFLHRDLNHFIWNIRLVQYSIFASLVLVIFVVFFCKNDFILKKSHNVKLSLECLNSRHKNINLFLFFAICALLILTVCSTTSPLYPIHSWDDSNCFMTVGKGVLYGKVIYRDLYEQKGPVLYFLHTLACFVSANSFLGVWIFQIVSAAVLLFFSYKLLKCLGASDRIVFILPPIFAILFSSHNFILGDSAEEFCFNLIMYPLFCSAAAISSNRKFTVKELILTGVCAGGVLWIKYTMCFFFIGWAIIPVCYYIKNRYKSIFSCILLVFSGVLISSIPVFVYFAVNHATWDLIQSYFINNIFLYNGDSSILKLPVFIVRNFLSFSLENPLIFILLVMSFCAVIFIKSSFIKFHLFFTFAALTAGIFSITRVHPYSSLILNVYAVFSALVFDKLILKDNLTICRKNFIFSAVISLLFASSLFSYIYIAGYKKADTPQYKFAQYINQFSDCSILNYGNLDLGFYLSTGIMPQNKYFCELAIPLPEKMEEQNSIINDGKVNFVVTNIRGGISSHKYELVMQEDFLYRNKSTYYLYKRKEK